jgi:hypothetical protein
MNRCLVLLLSALLACSAFAQAAPSAAPKIAVTSLVADTLTISAYRERTGTNVGNTASVLKMPGPLLDLAVLKAAQDAIGKAVPGASIAALRVPATGSNADPAVLLAADKAAPGNALLEALREQGFTQLVAATKYRSRNVVRLRDSVIGTGLLEGLGFYLDPTIRVQRADSVERADGIIAPFLYIQLRLLDLATLEVQAVQTITANAVASTAQNAAGVDTWGAMTAEEKIGALDALIKRHVGEAAAALFQPRQAPRAPQ